MQFKAGINKIKCRVFYTIPFVLLAFMATGKINSNNGGQGLLLPDTIACSSKELPGLFSKFRLNITNTDFKNPLFIAGNPWRLAYVKTRSDTGWLTVLNLAENTKTTDGNWNGELLSYTDSFILFRQQGQLYQRQHGKTFSLPFFKNTLLSVSPSNQYIAALDTKAIYRYNYTLNRIDTFRQQNMPAIIACANNGSLAFPFVLPFSDSLFFSVIDARLNTQTFHYIPISITDVHYITDLKFSGQNSNEIFFLIESKGIFKLDIERKELNLVMESCPAKRIGRFTLSDSGQVMVAEIRCPVMFPDNSYYWRSTLLYVNLVTQQRYIIATQ